ncbi:MAG: hypothetical protein P4L92_08525 [Rudaea sp.]|nr:hypothetical protein [Rudaea sp.]
MASEKYLAVIGLSEEDTAHLRLLLRMVAGQLEHRWRWGAEENADLVIVDPADMPGQIARNRAYSSGRRCAVFSETETLREGELRLARPPKAESVLAMLNGDAATATNLGAPVMQQKDDFYDLDTFTPEFEIEDEETAEARSRQRDTTPAPGLDELLKPDEASTKPQFAVPMQLHEDTRISYSSGTSTRSQRRVADSIEGFRKPGKQEGINMAPLATRGTTADAGKHALRDYLRGNLLGGPAAISLDGAPALTLDPKEKVFHAAGGLSALAPYCLQDLAHSAWRPVTTAALGRLRTDQPAQPYSRLIWLDVLTHSDGRLAKHLDPGGRYRLKGRPQVERDYPSHLRIIAALSQPAKLNEIAAASGVPMDEVFALINAYDAIGLIEVERRLPRHEPPAAGTGGLLARLRKPFGKR